MSKNKFFQLNFFVLISLIYLSLGFSSANAAPSAEIEKKAQTLSALSNTVDPKVVALALEAREQALADNISVARPSLITVIDYSQASIESRLHVFDIEQEALLYELHVTHGEGSGRSNYASRFSNASGSHQTSLGLFLTNETYHGKNGYSLRLDGLEAGINDNARQRAIVVHGAQYARPAVIDQLGGRLGTSWGCPAVDDRVSDELIDTIKGGSLMYAYHPDNGDWLKQSKFVNV